MTNNNIYLLQFTKKYLAVIFIKLMHRIYPSSSKVIKFFTKNYFTILNFLIIIFLLLLPYFLFEGKLFIGGDDTRLFYAYPKDYLINTQFFAWTNLSSVGWNFSYHSFLPFVSLWTILSEIIESKLILSYLAFSFSFILGLVFFQLLAKELIVEKKERYKAEILLGSLFYIFSPIIINNHFLNPLIPIWLIGLIPAVCYLFLRYLKTANLMNVLIASILTTIFSFGSHNTPWAGGFLIPIFLSITIGSFLFKKGQIWFFIRRFIIFFGILILTQSFWLFGFLMAFLDSYSSSFTAKIVSDTLTNEFARSVLATSRGTIIYPLLNLFPRQIAFDYNWTLKEVYLMFYDRIFFINIIFILILFLGILNFKTVKNLWERKIFVILLLAFLLSLYFFTVNIGPLLDLYILLGNIPGFILFRNPFDKFAMGFALIYSLLITYCLVILRRKFKPGSKKYLVLLFLFSLAIFANSIIPLRSIIVSPLWTTSKIYKNIKIPNEYLDFMDKIKNTVSSTNNIFSVPYGISLYTVIKDIDSNNVYVGVSPVIIFSGVNDISGNLSFNYASEANTAEKAIVNRNYEVLNNILFTHNINYVFVTKNIPEEVKKSFIFNQDVLKAQDEEFISNITKERIVKSSEGNYELYSAKKRNFLISSDNLSFKKISRVKYKILIKNIKGRQELLFNDSFHPGWKLYPMPAGTSFECKNPKEITETKTFECDHEINFFEISDLEYIWKDPVFENTHGIKNEFSNKWVIDPVFIKNNFNKDNYKINEDGSVDLNLVLYFKPQVYFYIGMAISILSFVILSIIVLKRK